MPRLSSIKITKKDNIYENHIRVSLPHLKQEIPLFILFKALGCISDKEIIIKKQQAQELHGERSERIHIINKLNWINSYVFFRKI